MQVSMWDAIGSASSEDGGSPDENHSRAGTSRNPAELDAAVFTFGDFLSRLFQTGKIFLAPAGIAADIIGPPQ